MCASLNSKATKYWSKSLSLCDKSDHQSRHQKVLTKLQSMFFECFLAFKQRINCYPSQVVLYTNARHKDNLQLELDSIQSILSKMVLPTKIAFVEVE